MKNIANQTQISTARKYIQEALNALQSLPGAKNSQEIQSTLALQKAQQALSSMKASLSPEEMNHVERSEQALLKAKQALLDHELKNN